MVIVTLGVGDVEPSTVTLSGLGGVQPPQLPPPPPCLTTLPLSALPPPGPTQASPLSVTARCTSWEGTACSAASRRQGTGAVILAVTVMRGR